MKEKCSIFLTGPSGTGKTTLAKTIQEKFGIPYLNELIRNSENILYSSFANRQVFFSLSYVSRHLMSKTDNFVSDRSIFDYIFWTFYNGENLSKQNYLADYNTILESMHLFQPSDIFVLSPLPKESFSETIAINFFNDPIRLSLYMNKYIDIHGYPCYTLEEFTEFLFKMESAMYDYIRFSLNDLGLNVIRPKGGKTNFFTWQDDALEQLETWKSS